MATVTGVLKFYHTESFNRRLLTNQRINFSSGNLQDFQLTLTDENPQEIPVLLGNKMLMIQANQQIEITIENEAGGKITLIGDCLLYPDSVSKIVVKKHLLNSNLHVIQC